MVQSDLPSSYRVTLTALVNMIRLLSAELVAGKYREDIDLLERAIRTKLNINVERATSQDLAEGLRRAHELLNPALAQVRNQALAAAGDAAATTGPYNRGIGLPN